MSQSTHTLAITMTADMGAAIVALNNSERKIRELVQAKRALGSMTPELTAAIDKEILALKQEQLVLGKRVGLVNQNAQINKNFSKSIAQVGTGSGKFNQAIGQAAFAVEDFMSVIETMGFSGAMRAAGNNLSMIGHILGGPLVGGAVGFAAVAAPMLIKKLFGIGEAAGSVTEKLTATLKALKDVQSVERLKFDSLFKMEDIAGIDSVDAIKSKIKELDKEIAGFQQDLLETRQKKLRAGMSIFDDVSIERQGVNNFKFLGKQIDALGDTAGKKLRDVVLPDIERQIKKINDRVKQDLIANPANTKRILEVARKELEALRTATIGEQGSIFGAALGADDLPNSARHAMEMLQGAASNAFKDLEQRLTLPTAELKSLKEELADLNQEEIKSGAELSEAQKQRVKALEEEIKLRETALLMIERASKADMDMAARASHELGRDPTQKKLLDDLMDKERALTEQFEASKGSPEDLKNYRERLAEIQNEKVEALTDMLGKNTDVVKDATISASNQAEAARAAVMLAEKQSREGSAKKEEIPRAEIVNALKNVEKAIKSGQTLVLQSGGSI